MVSPNEDIYPPTIMGMTIAELMDLPLPSISIQKKQWCRPSLEEVRYLYTELNILLFDDMLSIPLIKLNKSFKGHYGCCEGYDRIDSSGSYCVITLKDKWYSYSWLITVLAHEMCHQYQFDIEGSLRQSINKPRLMAHGPSFYRFTKKFNQFGIPLKWKYNKSKWFTHQDILKI